MSVKLSAVWPILMGSRFLIILLLLYINLFLHWSTKEKSCHCSGKCWQVSLNWTIFYLINLLKFFFIFSSSSCFFKYMNTSFWIIYWSVLQKKACLKPHSLPSTNELMETRKETVPDLVKIPTDGTDVWEIDVRFLRFENKVASGSYGDL